MFNCPNCNGRISNGYCDCRNDWATVRILDTSETADGKIAYYVGQSGKPRPNSANDVHNYRTFESAQRAAYRANTERGAVLP